jgi:hypothetical protein
MNDSLRTDIFLRFNPETIACACIDLAARNLQVRKPHTVQFDLLIFLWNTIDFSAEKSTMVSYIRRKISRDSLHYVRYPSVI